MLTELVVEGLGVIDRADVVLSPGCSALTGETGAGKTLLVAALGLLAGDRADRAMIRGDRDGARVEGRFEVPLSHPAVDFLAAHGILEDGPSTERVELVLARTILKDGRAGQARVNGRLVTTAILAGAGRTLVEIAGQHEHQLLTRPSHQRRLLDAFAGLEVEALAARVSAAARASAAARREAESLQAAERERERELDVLRYEIAEIEAAAPAPGEAEELRAEVTRLEHAETLGKGTAATVAALRDDGGVVDGLSGAASRVAELAGVDPGLAPLALRLEAAAYEAADIADELTARSVEPDPDALETARTRLALLARLRRKYGAEEDHVLAYQQRAQKRAGELDGVAADLDRWMEEASRADREAAELAALLSDARREAAPRLEVAVVELLATLALDRAAFRVVLEPRTLYDGGAETVSFLVAADKGSSPAPIAKVASGGELSRIALALHLLTATRSVPTMVFDEVDTGVGGEAARAVGEALARVAKGGAQALVVTHLPQVAAFADHHYRVLKQEAAGRMVAVVQEVEGPERVAELSRMLAGLPESERAREHAQELLELASDTVPP
ncbi:MAG: DNA repair protein RecN [Actinomycetota bacterium]